MVDSELRVGDLVRLFDEPDMTYRILEDRGDRVLVVALGTGLPIAPTACVSKEHCASVDK